MEEGPSLDPAGKMRILVELSWHKETEAAQVTRPGDGWQESLSRIVGLATVQGLSITPRRQHPKGKKLQPAFFLCSQGWPHPRRCNSTRLWEGQMAE